MADNYVVGCIGLVCFELTGESGRSRSRLMP